MAGNDFFDYVESEFYDALKNNVPYFSSDSNSDITKDLVFDNNNFDKSVVITISGLKFRLVIALHYSSASADEIVGILKLDNRDSLDDFLSELINTLAGSLKRKLQNYIPHMGMSTPILLDSKSLKYVDSIKINKQIGFSASANGVFFIGASLFISLYGEIDFSKQAIQDEDITGGLEFF